MRSRWLVPATLLTLAAACATPKIKDTEIKDTPDNRAILDVIEQFRLAYEKRDAPALLALASERYMEDGGTAGTEDDYDFDGLKAKLEGEDFARVLKARLMITIKKLEVAGDRAYVDMRIETRYQTGPIEDEQDPEWHMLADDNRMEFARSAGTWKVSSGM